MRFPKQCDICGGSLCYTTPKGFICFSLKDLVVDPSEEDKISWWCPKCQRRAKEEYSIKLESLAILNITLGEVLPFVTEESTKWEIDCARSAFRNPRSRTTHGDGYMHEYPFWTYGSCTCLSCCVYAVQLAKKEDGGGLSNVFSQTVLDAERWDYLLRYFPSLREFCEKALGKEASITVSTG